MGEVVPLPAKESPAEERPVLVLDLGGQYSQLIARRVRECSVYAEDAPKVDPRIFELGVPTLGICYGMQLMAQDLGGRVERTGISEFGKTDIRVHPGALFTGLPEEQTAWMSH